MNNMTLVLTAAVIGAFLGKYIGWAVRAWPGHEYFHCDYLKCLSCENGKKIGCYNSGSLQDRVYILISVIVAALSVYFFGFSIKAAVSWLFFIACMIVTLVDYRYYLIPDKISIYGCWAGLLYSIISSLVFKFGSYELSYHIDWLDSLAGFCLGYGGLKLLAIFAYVVLGKEGMGGGDVKLLGAMGAWAGWQAVLITIITASFIGSIGGISGIVYDKIKYHKEYVPMSHHIPFGPYLCIGWLLVFYLGKQPFVNILEAYQNFVLGN